MTLREYMRNQRLTDAALAEKIGCSRSAVCYWRNGWRIPRGYWMQRLHEVSDGKVSPADFYSSL